MTGIVYEDDSSIVEQRVSKRYISGSEKPGAVITINRLDPE
jgi:Holliday junction resolvase RusA-like endonuclease